MGKANPGFDRQAIAMSRSGKIVCLFNALGTFSLAAMVLVDPGHRAGQWAQPFVFAALVGLLTVRSVERLRIRVERVGDELRVRTTRWFRSIDDVVPVAEVVGADCEHTLKEVRQQTQYGSQLFRVKRVTVRTLTTRFPVDLVPTTVMDLPAVGRLAGDLDTYLRALPGVPPRGGVE